MVIKNKFVGIYKDIEFSLFRIFGHFILILLTFDLFRPDGQEWTENRSRISVWKKGNKFVVITSDLHSQESERTSMVHYFRNTILLLYLNYVSHSNLFWRDIRPW